jgi:hypothetical protein
MFHGIDPLGAFLDIAPNLYTTTIIHAQQLFNLSYTYYSFFVHVFLPGILFPL